MMTCPAHHTGLDGREPQDDGHYVKSSLAARVAQGYYTATGLWPVVSMKTFERVTGPKRDDWLVKTVGLLITVVGVTLIHAGRQPRIHQEIRLLAALSAAALASVDVVYVARRRISPVYLLDAMPEMMLLAWWHRHTPPSHRG
jgi:energy-converting hydrogenase Eha subunit E